MRQGATIVVGGKVIDRWISYSVSHDMTAPADEFSVEVGPVNRELYRLLRTDAAIQVYIEGTPVLDGFIDNPTTRFAKDTGSTINVIGRCKGGRLVDESMPLTTFRHKTLADIASQVAGPWFKEIRFSNAKNRGLIRGRRARAVKSWADPRNEAEAIQLREAQESGARIVLDRSPRAGIFPASKAPKKVDPGQTRWEVLSEILQPARLFAWATGDGEALVIGVPNTSQAASYRFFAPSQGSKRAAEGNVESLEVIDSTADRYSEVIVMGSVRGSSSSYGRSLGRTLASAFDGKGTDGVGRDFVHRKKLIISDDDVKNRRDALDRATREMAVRDVSRQVLEIEVDGHGQDGALYAFDTIADVEVEDLGLRQRYSLISVNFTGTQDGPMTRISLLPEGTTLAL